MLYVSSHKACFTLRLIPGEESDLLFPKAGIGATKQNSQAYALGENDWRIENQ
jgi:hypothetical protein